MALQERVSPGERGSNPTTQERSTTTRMFATRGHGAKKGITVPLADHTRQARGKGKNQTNPPLKVTSTACHMGAEVLVREGGPWRPPQPTSLLKSGVGEPLVRQTKIAEKNWKSDYPVA